MNMEVLGFAAGVVAGIGFSVILGGVIFFIGGTSHYPLRESEEIITHLGKVVVRIGEILVSLEKFALLLQEEARLMKLHKPPGDKSNPGKAHIKKQPPFEQGEDGPGEGGGNHL